MEAWLRWLWKYIRQHRWLRIGIIAAFIALTALALAVWMFGWDWIGFNGGYSQLTTTSTSHGTTTTTVKPPGKTLWDLLQLLGVLAIPVVVGIGAAWFTAQQAKVSERENKDNQREKALQDYIDKMSELLLKEHLGERTADGQLKPEYGQVRNVARVRTITVLTQLDARRIGYVFAFLREAELMSATKGDNAISLKNADLHAVDWSQADLRGADLRGVNLSEANLSGAIFSSIIYVPRAFGGTIVIPNSANLSGADLRGANLEGATGITKEELEKQTPSLKGATMPDGSKHL